MALSTRLVSTVAHRMPKYISPKTHAWIDYVTAGAYALVAVLSWRRNRAVSVAAMMHAGAIVGTSLMTDYPGGISRAISFETHARMDTIQATTAAAMPRLFEFSEDPAARFFEWQAVAEAAVIGMTDFEAARSRRWSRRRLAA